MSSFYSFRKNDYVDRVFQDIGYKGDYIATDGFFSQGILVSLGDVAIDKIGLTDPGLSYLVNFKPQIDVEAANKVSSQLISGVKSEGYTYTRFVHAKADTTYALRVIAYKSDGSRPNNSRTLPQDEMKFQSVASDKRADVIAVFRIIRKDADGNATIVWKRLSMNDAPKLKFPKTSNPNDSPK